MTRRTLMCVGALCLTLVIAACSTDSSTAPTPHRMTPAPGATHDRDDGCLDDGVNDIPPSTCDSTALTPNRSGYLVAAGRK